MSQTTPGQPGTLLRLGTRGSPLALWQAHWVRDRLLELLPDLAVEVVKIRTRAENFPEKSLARIGVGVFTEELDQALLSGEIDLAVHSLKDLPSTLRPDLRLAAVPPRETPLDGLVTPDGATLDELPRGARLGTGSPRRKAQLLACRPDLTIVPLRGNVDTRLRKVREEGLAGTILACAGLRRLEREEVVSEALAPEVLLPAVGQGALGLVVRAEDESPGTAAVARLDDPPSRARVLAERAFLRRLRGGCQVPAAALAEIEGDALHLRTLLAAEDGSSCLRAQGSVPWRGAVDDDSAEAALESLGERLAQELLDRGGRELLGRAPEHER